MFKNIISALFVHLAYNEFRQWLPKLTDKTFEIAIRNLPSHLRARFDQEWRADLLDTPGELTRFFQCVGFVQAAKRISVETHRTVTDEYLITASERVLERVVALGLLLMVSPVCLVVTFFLRVRLG